MHVITTEQIALIAIVFVVACASTLSRSIRDGDRRSKLRLFGLGCTSGFFSMGLYCVGSVHVDRALGSGANLFWLGVAAFIGFTAKHQDKIGSELFSWSISKGLGVAITSLQAIQTLTKKQDGDEK